jgi:hypothetical protein
LRLSKCACEIENRSQCEKRIYPSLFVRHQVNDYGNWKRAYDEFGSVRKGNGVTGASVHRDANDANTIIVTHSFKDMKAATDFANSEELKSAMENAAWGVRRRSGSARTSKKPRTKTCRDGSERLTRITERNELRLSRNRHPNSARNRRSGPGYQASGRIFFFGWNKKHTPTFVEIWPGCALRPYTTLLVKDTQPRQQAHSDLVR